MNEEIRVCKKHGITEFFFSKSENTWKCKKCSSDNVSKRRREIKRILVDYKGGKCEKCGYDKCIDALEFHHIDKNEKNFGISNGNCKSLEVLKKEADKCILLCSNCHKEIHYEEKLSLEEEKQKEIENNILNYDINCKSIDYRPQNAHILTYDDFSIIKEDVINGMTQKEMCKKYNVSLSTLKRFLTKYNLNNISHKKGNKLKDYTVDEFINDLVEVNFNKSNLAKKKGVKVLAIDEWCVKHNIPHKKQQLISFIKDKKSL